MRSGKASDLAFPAHRRLRNARAFKRVFERSARFGGHGIVALARANRQGHARLGLAIAKRCARRAVDRNRLKRLARESFRNVFAELPPVDVIVLCARGAPDLSNRQLRATLDQIWVRIRSTPWADS